ncbi:MAG: DUF6794 domain-containing protein [Leptospirales bacterium]
MPNVFKKSKVALLLMFVPIFAILLTQFIIKVSSHEKPKNLEQCWALLELHLQPDELEEVKSTDKNELVKFHFTIGRYIKRHWIVKGDAELLEFFDSAGIESKDAKMAIIIDTFWRHLNDKPIDVEERIQHYRNLQP